MHFIVTHYLFLKFNIYILNLKIYIKVHLISILKSYTIFIFQLYFNLIRLFQLNYPEIYS